jgi:acetate kinase
MEWQGFTLDRERYTQAVSGSIEISNDRAKIHFHVVPANETLAIGAYKAYLIYEFPSDF